MEEITINENLESVDNNLQMFTFPAVSVGDSHFYFNSATRRVVDINNNMKMRVFNTTNYVVFVPADENDPSAYAINRTRDIGFDVTLSRKLIKKLPYKGTFKLYKYKDGWCFKKYEPLCVR